MNIAALVKGLGRVWPPRTGKGWVAAAAGATAVLVVGIVGLAPEQPDLPAKEGVAHTGDAVVEVSALLDGLPVKGHAPAAGYDRTGSFGPAWTDDVTVQGGRNGCDTRNDIRRRDMTDVIIKPGSKGCKVIGGTLHDKYTGKTIAFAEVQVDHIVALKNAWITGAQQIHQKARIDLANDPLNLIAVDGSANQSKGDKSADAWLPPNENYRCEYVLRQIMVKSRYGLWVTEAEKSAMRGVLGTC